MYSGIYAIGASKKITKEAYNKDTYEEINKAYVTTIEKLRGMLTNYFSIFSFFLVSQGVYTHLWNSKCKIFKVKRQVLSKLCLPSCVYNFFYSLSSGKHNCIRLCKQTK